FDGISMQQLAVSDVHGNMCNPFLIPVDPRVSGSGRTLIAHKKDQVPSLQIANPIDWLAVLLDPRSLLPGIGRQRNAKGFLINMFYEIGAVKGSRRISVGSEFVRRAHILF